MSNIQSGDQIRHRTWGIGTVERIERNAFGKVTRAHVRFRGDLVRIWIDDAAVIERGSAPEPERKRMGVIDGGLVA